MVTTPWLQYHHGYGTMVTHQNGWCKRSILFPQSCYTHTITAYCNLPQGQECGSHLIGGAQHGDVYYIHTVCCHPYMEVGVVMLTVWYWGVGLTIWLINYFRVHGWLNQACFASLAHVSCMAIATRMLKNVINKVNLCSSVVCNKLSSISLIPRPELPLASSPDQSSLNLIPRPELP